LLTIALYNNSSGTGKATIPYDTIRSHPIPGYPAIQQSSQSEPRALLVFAIFRYQRRHPRPKIENQRPDTKRPATPGHNGHSFSKIGGLIYLSANSLSQKAFSAGGRAWPNYLWPLPSEVLWIWLSCRIHQTIFRFWLGGSDYSVWGRVLEISIEAVISNTWLKSKSINCWFPGTNTCTRDVFNLGTRTQVTFRAYWQDKEFIQRKD